MGAGRPRRVGHHEQRPHTGDRQGVNGTKTTVAGAVNKETEMREGGGDEAMVGWH